MTEEDLGHSALIVLVDADGEEDVVSVYFIDDELGDEFLGWRFIVHELVEEDQTVWFE